MWGLDSWARRPDDKYLPQNTFIKRDMAWSKMNGSSDSFTITLQCPKGTLMNFMIWITKDSTGKSTDGWDTYGEQTYSGDFTGDRTIILDDSALWMPKNDFNILRSGLIFFLAAATAFILSLFLNRKKMSFSWLNFLTAFLVFAIVIAFVVRSQMNGWFENNRFAVVGSVFYDLLWYLFLSMLFFGLIYLSRNRKVARNIISVVFSLFLVLSVFYSLINIEIVNKIGKPLNYQWLYYSNFMNGVDAKNTISEHLTKPLVLNLVLLCSATLLFAFAASLIKRDNSKKTRIVLVSLYIVLILTSWLMVSTNKYDDAKIENPAIAIISSSLFAKHDLQLYSLKVSDTKNYIEAIHSNPYSNAFDSSHSIKNIILFVLESTPWNFISNYDKTFNVTPNLLKWKSISLQYNNMYAHIPATPNSMGNIISGIYPLISYESFILEYPHNIIPSIPKQLSKEGWQSSLFFSADLKFSNIGGYAGSEGFNHMEDYSNLNCTGFKKFDYTHTSLDGYDDRCLIESYFKWYDQQPGVKKFSLMWTNQTHDPYISDSDIVYTKSNENLNRYLNALKTGDQAKGLLMDGLVKRNALNNTLVIVVADHGEAFGTHNQFYHASKIYEENVHIPCIFYNPEFFHGSENNEIAGLIDLAPTICHFTGIPKPKEWQGKSMLSGADPGRTFFICPYSDFLFGTRDKNWKYIFNATRNSAELFDLSNDPGELNNVYKQFPDVVKKEHEILAAWVQYHIRKLKEWEKK